MQAPVTYAEWVSLLDQFGQGDDTTIEALSKGSFVVDAGTASRFYLKVEEVYKKRKQAWLIKFQRSFDVQYLKTEDDFGIALRNGKQNLYTLLRFISLQGFPVDLKEMLKTDLEDFVSEIKKSLKTNISKVSRGKEKMLVLLNTFGLHEVPQDSQPGNNISKQNTDEQVPPTGRKIIF